MPAKLSILIAASITTMAVATAHPVSHTDAWVTVGDVVSVRLKVFLDDVARHQMDLREGQTRVPAQDLRRAVVRHADTLTKQLLLFQNGVLLTGSVTAVPGWRPNSEEVDLAADASLKLMWDLEFRPAVPNPESLCFLHHFTHVNLQQPGELRLNLRQAGSGRRISAVLPPDRPHTIILPASSPSPAEDEFSTDPNSASSTWVVTPAAVIHELKAPLVLMDTVWPEAQDFRQHSFDAGSTSVKAADVRVLRTKFAQWYRTSVRLRDHESEMVPTRLDVVFFPDGTLSEAVPPEADDAEVEIPLFGSAVGIRAVYPAHERFDMATFTLDVCPGQFSDLVVTTVMGAGVHSELVSFRSGPDEMEPERPALQYHWKSFADQMHLPVENPLQVRDEVLSSELVKAEGVQPGTVGRIFGLLLVAGTFMMVVMKKRRILSLASLLTLLCLTVGVAFIVLRQESVVVADNQAVTAVVENLLAGVYGAAHSASRSESVTELSKYLDDDLVESVHLATMASLMSAETGEVFVDLKSVSVDEAGVVLPKSSQTLETECCWRVSGIVHHWGHTHRRELFSRGRIGLIRDEGRWKIERIALSEAGRMSDPAADDGSS